MAGVKSLLGAAAKDIEQTTKAQAKPKENILEDVKPETDTVKKTAVTTNKKSETNAVRSAANAKNPAAGSKINKGGRPRKNAEDRRHQYTLTLTNSKREQYMEYLDTEDAKVLRIKSFSELAEAAMDEYIKNHSNQLFNS